MYFSSDQVSNSFKRLVASKKDGKTHMERTSALMYFLAFDTLCKNKGGSPLDFDPENADGRANRKAIELEFTKLVLLGKTRNKIVQVLELGNIANKGKDPEKRISSNFLTVPLKKASEHSTPFSYPKRPTTPLMKLGYAATGEKWGIDYHDSWTVNLPKLLSHMKYTTCFSDLAVFVFRDTYFENSANDYITTLSSAIKSRYSKNLSEFWIDRIEKEKLFAGHLQGPNSDKHDSFGKSFNSLLEDSKADWTSDQLLIHIQYLENLLAVKGIDFKPL